MKKNNIITLNIKTAEEKPKDFKFYVKKVVHMVIFCICALVIGIITGAVDAVFGITLLKITGIREDDPFYYIPFLCLAGLLIFFIYDRFGKEIQGGMSLIFERAQNKRTMIKLRLIPLVTLSTWITHLFGGSAGREGVAVQIGGTIGSFVSQKLHLKNQNSAKILTISGMAAGFGGLFRTPIAAVFFATEVLSAGYIEVSALLPAMISAYTASYVSGKLGLDKFTVISDIAVNIDIYTIVIFFIAAVCFGIVGGGFAYLQKMAKKYMAKLMPNPYIKIAVTGAVISIFSLLLYGGRYSGLGTNIISAAFNDGEIYYWDFILKLVFTVVTLSAGFQGGEVTPLFAIGASFGAVIAVIFNMPVVLFAALGYAAVFGAATNTLIAPVFIGAEVFGYQYMPYFFVVCVIAYIFNGGNSIYSLQVNSGDSKIIQIKKH